MARLACACITVAAPSVLIGGLGMGYTLRAALDVLPGESRVIIAEAVAEIITWNRGPLAQLAGDPLKDARVTVACCDVADMFHSQRFDAILLDVDNGPAALSLNRNRRLYTADGVAAICRALRPAGVLAVWSADRSAPFEAALRQAGLRWRANSVPARGLPDDPEHTIYVAEQGQLSRQRLQSQA